MTATLQRFTDFILRGRSQAMVTAFLLGCMPVIGLLGSVIAAFVTLRKSIHDGVLVFIFAMLPVLLLVTNLPHDTATASVKPINMVVMLVSINFLTLLGAIILKFTSSWSLVLDILGLLGFIVVVVLHLCFPNLAEFWQHWVVSYMAALKDTMGSAADNIAATTNNNINVLKDYVTGQVVLVFGTCALLLLLAARWWQDAIYNPGGLRKELLEVRLSKLSALVVMVGFVLSFLHVAMIQDAMPIMLMFYAFAGLSLMHYVIAAKHMSWSWLIVIYLALLVVPFVLVVPALFDTVFDYRKRYPVKSLIS